MKLVMVGGTAVALAVVCCYWSGHWAFLFVALCGFSAWVVIVHQLLTMLKESSMTLNLSSNHRFMSPDIHQPTDYMHLEAAENLLRSGNLNGSKNQLDSVSLAFHRNPDYQRLRYNIASQEGRWQAALEAAESFKRYAPDEPQAYVSVSTALLALNLPGKALDFLLESVTYFPDDPRIHYQLACATCRANRMDESLKWLRTAFSLGQMAHLLTDALRDPFLMPLRRSLSRKALADKIIGDGLLPVEELAREFADMHGIPASSYATALHDTPARPLPVVKRSALPPLERLSDNVHYSDAVLFVDSEPESDVIRAAIVDTAKSMNRPLLDMSTEQPASKAIAELSNFLATSKATRLYITGSSCNLSKTHRLWFEEVLEKTLEQRLKPLLLGTVS